MFGRKSNSFRKKRKFHSDGIRFPFEWNFRLDYFLISTIKFSSSFGPDPRHRASVHNISSRIVLRACAVRMIQTGEQRHKNDPSHSQTSRGAPYEHIHQETELLLRSLSSVNPNSLNILSCNWLSWMRIEPPPLQRH